MTDPTDYTSTRRMFTLNKVIVLSATLGALAVIVVLFMLFPFQCGIAIGILVAIGYGVASSLPTVKKTTTHTTTTKRG